MVNNIWNYIINHKWSKDILRANILFIVLVLLYNIFHFKLQPINWHFFWRTFWLMNLCLGINLLLNMIDQAISEN